MSACGYFFVYVGVYVIEREREREREKEREREREIVWAHIWYDCFCIQTDNHSF